MINRFVPSGLLAVVGKMLRGNDGLYAERAREIARSIDAKAEMHHWTVCEPQKDFEPGDPYYDHLIAEIEQASKAAEVFEAYIAFYERLIEPDLMSEVYDWLRDFDQASWGIFVISARQARFDDKQFRELRRKALQNAGEIEETANRLASLISNLRDAAVILPPVLREASNENSMISLGSGVVARAKLRRIVFEGRTQLPNPDFKDAVPWLRSIAKAASTMEVQFACPAINAALEKRQKSKKSGYLRAFAALLEEADIELTSNVMKAMAITANVVFDQPEFEASDDDVRKAIGRARSSEVRKTGRKKSP